MPSESNFLRTFLKVGTSTLWKVLEFNAVAFFRSSDIGVAPLSRFVSHHSAVEDRDTAQENLGLKFADILSAAARFRKNGPDHKAFLSMLVSQGIRFLNGPSRTMERSFVLGDDTTLAIPKIIWDAMLPQLQKLVVSDSLKASVCPIEGDQDIYMSVADIGPIMAAVGQKQFWQIVRQTASRLPEYADAPIKVYHQVSCATTRLSDPENIPAYTLEAHTLLHVYAPNKFSGDVPVAPHRLIPTTEDFLCLPESPNQPISANYRDFLLNHSTRKKIFDQFIRLTENLEKELSPQTPEEALFDAQTEIALRAQKRKRRGLKVVQVAVGCTSLHGKIGDFVIKERNFPNESLDHRGFANALSGEFDFGKKDRFNHPVAEHADAIILGSFDAGDPIQLAYNTLMLRSLTVAKATDRRYHNVPVIILNHNGCWNAAIKSHIAYANSGYNKVFVREPVHDLLAIDKKIISPEGIEHLALLDMDVLSGGDLTKLYRSADEVAAFRLETYARIEQPKLGLSKGGKPKPDDMCLVTVFASASSDKFIDHQNAIEIGRILGEFGMGLRTGGGDQHLMYAPIHGYNQTRISGKSYLSCISTHEIVKVETAHNRLPQCDHYELHDTISPRLRTLGQSDMFISVGGGDGTGQETALILREKLMSPATENDKMMIFVGQDPSMIEEIRSVLGAQKTEQLLNDPCALANMGIFLFKNAQQARPTIELGLREFHAKRVLLQQLSQLVPSAIVPNVA